MKKVIFLLAVYCSLLQTKAASLNKIEVRNETNETTINNTEIRNVTKRSNSTIVNNTDIRNETNVTNSTAINKINETKVVFNFNLPNNTYYYSVETPEETVKYESSHVETDSSGKDHLAVKGGYELNTKDLYYVVTYTADEKGYRPRVKFNFGTNVEIGTRIGPPKKPDADRAGPKGIDPTLMCSLIGGGCK